MNLEDPLIGRRKGLKHPHDRNKRTWLGPNVTGAIGPRTSSVPGNDGSSGRNAEAIPRNYGNRIAGLVEIRPNQTKSGLGDVCIACCISIRAEHHVKRVPVSSIRIILRREPSPVGSANFRRWPSEWLQERPETIDLGINGIPVRAQRHPLGASSLDMREIPIRVN